MSRRTQKLLLAGSVVLTLNTAAFVGSAIPQNAAAPSIAADLNAPLVDVLIADLGPMARIELKWPTRFHAVANADSRQIRIDFDKPFNAPDLGALRHRLSHWVTGISKTANSIVLSTAGATGFDTYTDGNSLILELRQTAEPVTPPRQLAALPGPAGKAAITLTPPKRKQTRPAVKTNPPATPPLQRPAHVSPAPEKLAPPSQDEARARLRFGQRQKSSTYHAPQSRQLSQLLIGGDETSPAKATGGNRQSDRLVIAKNDVSVVRTATADQLKLEIDWGTPIGLISEVSGRELLIRLDRPLTQETFSALGKQNEDWLESVSTGYDSLLLVSRTKVKFHISHNGRKTSLILSRIATGEQAGDGEINADPETRRKQTRLELLRARLQARQGKTETARKKLEKLQAQNPENTDVTLELAELHRSVGSWHNASGLYDSVLARRPGQLDAAIGKRELTKQHADRVRIDHDVQLVEDGDTQHITRLSGHVNVAERLRIGISAENRYLDDDQVQRVDGTVSSAGLSRQRGELYAVYETIPGQRLTGAILFGPASPGVSAAYTWQTPRSEFTLQGEWHRPHWDFVEGIVDNAVRDAVSARYSRQLSQRWSMEMAIGYNRYSIGDIDNAAGSISTEASVNYLLPVEVVEMTVGYSISGQYVLNAEKRVDAGGALFRPLPLTPTEIHSLNTSVAHRFTDTLFGRAFASLSRDRYQTNLGPTFGGELNWEVNEDMEIGVRGSHSRISGRGDAAVFTRFGGFLLYRF